MGARGRHLDRLVVAVVLAGVAVTGCRGRPAGAAAIVVDRPVALVDEPVHLKVTGLTGGSLVTVTAQTVDLPAGLLRARATYRADKTGTVDLERTGPTSGTYGGVDGMGLFWSMYPLPVPVTPQPSPPPASAGFPAGPGYHVRLTATVAGKQVATATLTRRWYQPGVAARPLTLRDGVVGVLFRPPAGTPRHPAVLIFGGSEGGNTQRSVAALLASHGYPALSLAYFHAPGLPGELRDIPLEYFATAARLLAATPGVTPAHVIVCGTSRGAEAALLVAQNFPDLVHGAVLYASPAVVLPAYPNDRGFAWTLRGKPVPEKVIPVDRVSGPVLAIAGDHDALESSDELARQIDRELSEARNPYPHRVLVYHGAGHDVGGFPFWPHESGQLDLGGTPAADQAARQAGWPTLLGLLASLANRP